MLLDGELDAVLGEKVEHPDLKPLFPDAAAEEKSWFAKHRVMPINHMVVVSEKLSRRAIPMRCGKSHRLLAGERCRAARQPANAARWLISLARSEHAARFADELIDDVRALQQGLYSARPYRGRRIVRRS